MPRIFRSQAPSTFFDAAARGRGHVYAVLVLDSYPKRWIATTGYRKSGLIYIYIYACSTEARRIERPGFINLQGAALQSSVDQSVAS
jgi:hypothetical protein